MDHQNWNKQVYTSKAKLHNKNLHQKVLNDDGVKSLRKPSGHGKVSEGKKLHNILESESLQVPTDNVGLGRALLQARTAQKIKQKEFAQKIGIKESTLKHWETGKEIPTNPQIAKMEKILKTKLPRPKKLKL